MYEYCENPVYLVGDSGRQVIFPGAGHIFTFAAQLSSDVPISKEEIKRTLHNYTNYNLTLI